MVPLSSRLVSPIWYKLLIAVWGRGKSDMAFVALKKDQLIAAVWGRMFSTKNKGHGFVNNHTPEISMAVLSEYRNQGIGKNMLQLIEQAYVKQGIKTLSLSVNCRNKAKKLYERSGYNIYRIEKTAVTMLKIIAQKNIKAIVVNAFKKYNLMYVVFNCYGYSWSFKYVL